MAETRTKRTTTPRQKKASVEVLRATIDEQRRVYDQLLDMKKSVSIKTLTLAGAGLALFTYLYSGGTLFIPADLYGRILYGMGAVLAIGAMAALLYAVKPSGRWEFPTETENKLRYLDEDNEREYLEYVKDQYIRCYQHNIINYHKKLQLMNLSFFPLLFGAIILVTIKILEGNL